MHGLKIYMWLSAIMPLIYMWLPAIVLLIYMWLLSIVPLFLVGFRNLTV
jgi:hypothetical protein